jgi:mono/diheme cytochrome c family protein
LKGVATINPNHEIREGPNMTRWLKRASLLVPVFAVGLSPVWGSAADKTDPKALFEARCSICHDISRPLGKTKTAAEWRKTVMRMKGKAGGKISDAEAETIIKYLTEIRGK